MTFCVNSILTCLLLSRQLFLFVCKGGGWGGGGGNELLRNRLKNRFYCGCTVNQSECYVIKIIHFKQLFQSLEEERIAFLRNAMWVYTNTTSLNCVKVDEVRGACAESDNP